MPVRIPLLDEPDLPGAIPPLEPLLSRDRLVDIIERLEVNETIHPVLLREALNLSLPVLLRATHKVIRHSDVECTAETTGEDVDKAGPPPHHPFPSSARRYAPSRAESAATVSVGVLQVIDG